MGKELDNFLELLKKTSGETHFDEMAKCLMNELCLVANDKSYRITEIEMYYYDEVNHPDDTAHKRPEQLENGTWYFNDFGLDITFGKKEYEIYGGILIRGIKSLDKPDCYINGPSKVLREIFSQISIKADGNGIFLRDVKQAEFEEETPVKGTRVNIPKEKIYKNKPYRYVVNVYETKHAYKDKTKIQKLSKEQRGF